MLKTSSLNKKHQSGMSMIEVLVTIVILAFGLLGLAALHMKMQAAALESQQRAQAVTLLSDIKDRISTNRAQAADYIVDGLVGTGDARPLSCTGLSSGPQKDLCEWSNALKGQAEQGTVSNTGAMIGARGCITQLNAANTAAGVCVPATYRVSIVWQGVHKTAAPSLTCGQGTYGNDDDYRRVIASDIVIGLPECV